MIWLTALVFVAVPLVGTGFQIRYILFVWHLRQKGIAVTGYVIQQREWHHRGSISFIPTVRFTTLDGDNMEVENSRKRSTKEFLADQQVLVFYDPQQPTAILFAEQVTNKALYLSLLLLLPLLALLFFIWRAIARDLFGLVSLTENCATYNPL